MAGVTGPFGSSSDTRQNQVRNDITASENAVVVANRGNAGRRQSRTKINVAKNGTLTITNGSSAEDITTAIEAALARAALSDGDTNEDNNRDTTGVGSGIPVVDDAVADRIAGTVEEGGEAAEKEIQAQAPGRSYLLIGIAVAIVAAFALLKVFHHTKKKP